LQTSRSERMLSLLLLIIVDPSCLAVGSLSVEKS
jgi:hypothetical protein